MVLQGEVSQRAWGVVTHDQPACVTGLLGHRGASHKNTRENSRSHWTGVLSVNLND